VKFHPGLRHNKHMVRLVKTTDARTPYALGTSYGNAFTPVDDTERRRRILDQWCMPNQSPRLPESTSTAEELTRRAQRSYFHQMSSSTQDLLSRRLSAAPMDRRDVRPGTKSRAHLDHGMLRVESWPTLRSPQLRTTDHHASTDARLTGRQDAFTDSFGQYRDTFTGSINNGSLGSRKR
jgi:hypothetical protein